MPNLKEPAASRMRLSDWRYPMADVTPAPSGLLPWAGAAGRRVPAEQVGSGASGRTLAVKKAEARGRGPGRQGAAPDKRDGIRDLRLRTNG